MFCKPEKSSPAGSTRVAAFFDSLFALLRLASRFISLRAKPFISWNSSAL